MSKLILNITSSDLMGPDIRLIDNPLRVKYNSSWWHSIFHCKQKQQLNKQIWQAVSTFFQERYHISDKHHFERIWQEIGRKTWSMNSPLTTGALRDIDDAFHQQLLYHGQGIIQAPELNPHPNSTVQQLVKALLHGGKLTKDLIKKPLLQAVFLKKDHTWLQQFRSELQHELAHLAEKPPINENEKIVWNGFLNNILALLPFAYPTNDEIVSIPVLNTDGSCRLVNYRANVLELTPSSASTPVSAIGLSPENDQTASPILTFLGTTFPGGDGFAATVLADFTPGMSVGEAVYNHGHTIIDTWMRDKNNVRLIGTSLGGALAFHTLLHHQAKVSHVDVFNPPGLYDKCWNKRQFHGTCEINIYCQTGDIVSKMGSWPIGKNVKLYNVLPHQRGVTEGVATSHARIFTGCQKVTILKKEPKKENENLSRRILTLLHKFLGPWLIYYPVSFLLCAYRVSRATKRYWHSLWHKPRPNST